MTLIQGTRFLVLPLKEILALPLNVFQGCNRNKIITYRTRLMFLSSLSDNEIYSK